MKTRTITLAIFTSITLTGCFTMDALQALKEKAIEINKPALEMNKRALCEQNEKSIQKTYDYAIRNFKRAYGDTNDVEGAMGQLFLIKNSKIGSFAKNYNAAEESYNKYLKVASQNECDTSQYPSSPITTFENEIKKLQESS